MGNRSHGQWGTWAMGPMGIDPIPLYPIAHTPVPPFFHRPHGPCGLYLLYTIAPLSITPAPHWVMGHMGNGGNGVHGVWATWAMGPMGNVETGGKGVQGIWGTWPMRPTAGMGYRAWAAWAIAAQGVWGTRGMGHMGNRSHGQWGTWAMGPMGHGAYGQWGPWAIWTFLPITSLILGRFLQKSYCT